MENNDYLKDSVNLANEIKSLIDKRLNFREALIGSDQEQFTHAYASAMSALCKVLETFGTVSVGKLITQGVDPSSAVDGFHRTLYTVSDDIVKNMLMNLIEIKADADSKNTTVN